MRSLNGILVVSCLLVAACGKDSSQNSPRASDANRGEAGVQTTPESTNSCEDASFFEDGPAAGRPIAPTAIKTGLNEQYVLWGAEITEVLEAENGEKSALTIYAGMSVDHLNSNKMTPTVVCADWQGTTSFDVVQRVPAVITNENGNVSLPQYRDIHFMTDGEITSKEAGKYTRVSAKLIPGASLKAQTSLTAQLTQNTSPSNVQFQYYGFSFSDHDIELRIRESKSKPKNVSSESSHEQWGKYVGVTRYLTLRYTLKKR